MKRMKKTLLSLVIIILINAAGCTFENNNSDGKRSHYISYVSMFGPNNSVNNSYYHYVRNNDGFIYSKISKYDIKTSDDYVVFYLDDSNYANRITDYFGNDSDLFIVVTKINNNIENSYLYHHDNNSGKDQIITEISGKIFLIRKEMGIIVRIDNDEENNKIHYYTLNKNKSSFQLSEINKPESNVLNNNSSTQIIKLEDGKSVVFTKNAGEAKYSYSIDGISGDIDALTSKNALESGIYNHLLVEGDKIIGALQFTEWSYGICPKNLLRPRNLKGSALFEFDINTHESKILYEIKGNKTQIVGYREGKVYLYRNGKVIRKTINGEKEEVICSVDNNNHQLSFNWLNDTLLIFDEEDYVVVGSCNG